MTYNEMELIQRAIEDGNSVITDEEKVENFFLNLDS
jgi:hypothetical protein